jgi:O-antigen ligase
MATGTGPGTFSSRAWRTFADTNSTSRSDVAGPYVMALTRGASYRTDVSERYVVPRLRSAQAVQGSRAVNSPLSSYLSLLAEVGVLGAVLLVAIYVAALSRAVRMTLRAVRWRTPQDPLPALALASTTAFCVVLQMAALENWLEVTRVTFVTWILFAVLTKEHEARWSE